MRSIRKGVDLVRSLDPVLLGIGQGLGSVVCLTVAALVAFSSLGMQHASAAVFRDLTGVAVGLLIAFAVATAAVRIQDGEALRDHLSWLGFACGLGLASLIAIGFCVGAAAYREAGHAGVFDELALGWVAVSLLVTGIVVATLPYVTFFWNQSAERR